MPLGREWNGIGAGRRDINIGFDAVNKMGDARHVGELNALIIKCTYVLTSTSFDYLC